MKLYAIVDKDTGEQLAWHGENGPTLAKWLLDCTRRGHNCEIQHVTVSDEPEAKP